MRLWSNGMIQASHSFLSKKPGKETFACCELGFAEWKKLVTGVRFPSVALK